MRLIVSLVCLVAVSVTSYTSAEDKAVATTRSERSFLMGFTPFPWDFSYNALKDTYRGVTESGDIICHQLDGGVPWREALEDKPYPEHVLKDWKIRRNNTLGSMRVYLALTPLNSARSGLALYHGGKENDSLPKIFAGKTLDNPDVVKAYLTYCRKAIEHFKPHYLAIGIDVNELVEQQPEAWKQYQKLHEQVYDALKKDHPNLPIFATVSLHNLFKESRSQGNHPQQDAVHALMPKMDILGVSYYSFINTVGDPSRPREVLDWLKQLAENKPIAITETGFPAEATELAQMKTSLPGSPEKQAAYYKMLLEIASRDHYRFVISCLYRDFDALWARRKNESPGWMLGWRDCGLLDGEGKPRPAFDQWKYFRGNRYKP